MSREERGATRRGADWLASQPDRSERDRMSGGGMGGGFGGGGGYDRGPPREELPLPDKPPYTAFIGNLAFDLQDADVAEFFAPSKVSSLGFSKGQNCEFLLTMRVRLTS